MKCETREERQTRGLVIMVVMDNGGDVGIPEDGTCDGGGGETGR